MMLGTARAWQETVPEMLGECFGKIEAKGPRQWHLKASSTRSLSTDARLEDEWLILEARVRGRKRQAAPCASRKLLQILELNGQLGGGARVALTSDGLPRVKAEIPVGRGVPIDVRIKQAASGLKCAARALFRKRTREQGSAEDVAANARASDYDMRPVLDEAGWSYVERSGGKLAVTLEAPDAFHQAIVKCHGDETVRIAVELASDGSLSPVRTQALALLLLTVSDTVRMARPTIEAADGYAARFEVTFGSPPCAAEVAHALAALSVACRLCAKESKVLCLHDGVAQEYVCSRGWSPE